MLMFIKGIVMINVNDVFINVERPQLLRVLSMSCVGVHCEYYCLIEYKGECWNEYHTAYFIEKYYTKMENL